MVNKFDSFEPVNGQPPPSEVMMVMVMVMMVMTMMVMVVMLSVKSRAKEESGDISSWRTIVEEKI